MRRCAETSGGGFGLTGPRGVLWLELGSNPDGARLYIAYPAGKRARMRRAAGIRWLRKTEKRVSEEPGFEERRPCSAQM